MWNFSCGQIFIEYCYFNVTLICFFFLFSYQFLTVVYMFGLSNLFIRCFLDVLFILVFCLERRHFIDIGQILLLLNKWIEIKARWIWPNNTRSKEVDPPFAEYRQIHRHLSYLKDNKWTNQTRQQMSVIWAICMVFHGRNGVCECFSIVNTVVYFDVATWLYLFTIILNVTIALFLSFNEWIMDPAKTREIHEFCWNFLFPWRLFELS